MKIILKTDVGVRPFGSFVSNMYTKWGDLDTFIELSHCSPSSTGREQMQKVLRNIMRVLRRNGILLYRFLLQFYLSFAIMFCVVEFPVLYCYMTFCSEILYKSNITSVSSILIREKVPSEKEDKLGV